MKETMLDKCIKTNFKMVENEIAIACTMALVLAFSFINLFIVLLSPVPLIISVIFLYKMCKKLFYTSIFGETATTYQSLPASTREMAAAKVFVGGLGIFAADLSMFLVLAAVLGKLGGVSASDLMGALEILGGGTAVAQVSIALPLEFLVLVVTCFCQSGIIFMAVAAYNTMREKNRHGFRGILVYLGPVAANYVMMRCGEILSMLGLKYGLWFPALKIVIFAAALVFVYRRTVKMLEERYELK